MISEDFESILVPKDKSKIQMNLIQTNIKNMLLAVMVINQYVLMINSASLLTHTIVIVYNLIIDTLKESQDVMQ